MELMIIRLVTGDTIVGYILETNADTMKLLKVEEHKFSLVTIYNTAIQDKKIIRPITPAEQNLLNQYKKAHTQKEIYQSKIKELESEINKITLDLSNALEEGTHTHFQYLTLNHIQHQLTKTGYQNLFELFRKNKLLLNGEKEELVIPPNKRFEKKYLIDVVDILNSYLSPDDILNRLLSLTNTDKTSAQNKENLSIHQPSNHHADIHLNDIREKLTEHGFQQLRQLESMGIIRIDEEGRIDLGNLTKIPFLGKFFQHKDIIAKVLNESLPIMNVKNNQAIPIFQMNLQDILNSLSQENTNKDC